MIKKVFHFLSDGDYRFQVSTKRGWNHSMPDDEFLKRMFRIKLGYELDLDNPKTYNEKLQWLKIHDHNPDYTKLVDKYEVKSYVSDVIGDEYVIPTLGIWDRFEDVDFNMLPNEFVLKCTHDSGGVVLCKDRSSFDIKAARKIIASSLKNNYYYKFREWPYKNVKPRIIAEKYLEDKEKAELWDYKFFTFNGEAKALFIATDRQDKTTETKFDFYDMNFNHLNLINGHPNSEKVLKKPAAFEEMKQFAEKLSQNIPHVRVDFYEVNGKVYFGEMTFYHWSGFVPFVPEEWDSIFGSWITLPEEGKANKR